MIPELAKAYFAAEARPATITYDFRKHPDNDDEILTTPSNDNTLSAFIIRNVLTPSECDQLMKVTEDHGIVPPGKDLGTLRTAKRTKNYSNPELSSQLQDRLLSTNPDIVNKLTRDDNWGSVGGIHTNWRVVKYDPTDSFCAHQDQMDSIQVPHKDGTKDLLVSSHTLLINLSEDTYEGGATRFYPNSSPGCKALDQYDHRVDVYLPRGWALCFRQKSLMHAGQPLVRGTKYVAQAGILRLVPPGVLLRPSVFQMGPGLADYRDLKSTTKGGTNGGGVAGDDPTTTATTSLDFLTQGPKRFSAA